MKSELLGKRFDRLLVIEECIERRHRKVVWKCFCDCGNIVYVTSGDLNNGHTRSCGCIRIEELIQRESTHRCSKTKLYGVWGEMKSRCYNERHEHYNAYGGRGITICDAWLHSFEEFRDWALNSGYKEGLTIERMNVNGNYDHLNCKWIPLSEQPNNTRVNRIIEYNGISKNIKEWADKKDLIYSCLLYRIDHGWNTEKALNTPSRKSK